MGQDAPEPSSTFLGRISIEDTTMRHATLGLIVTLTLGILLSPLASAAQSLPKVYQIGTLWLGFSSPSLQLRVLRESPG
jgi:hypothetical protein